MSSPTVNQKYTSLLIDDKTHLTKSTYNHIQVVSTNKSLPDQQQQLFMSKTRVREEGPFGQLLALKSAPTISFAVL